MLLVAKYFPTFTNCVHVLVCQACESVNWNQIHVRVTFQWPASLFGVLRYLVSPWMLVAYIWINNYKDVLDYQFIYHELLKLPEYIIIMEELFTNCST